METREVLAKKLSHIWNGQRKIPKGPPLAEVLDAIQHRFLDYLIFESPRLMKQYGGVIRLTDEQYMIADANAFKQVLKTNPNNYSKNNMTYERIKLLLGNGTITLEGSDWSHHRNLIAPFYERSKLPAYANKMIHITQQLLTSWENKKTINIMHEMGFLTFRLLLDIYCQHEAKEHELQTMCDLLHKGGAHISYGVYPNPWIPTYGNFQFFNLIRKTNKTLQKLIDTRRTQRLYPANPSQPIDEDLLDLLLGAEATTGKGLTDPEIRDELRTLLFASQETLSCGLVWCFYLLAKHPHYWDLLKNELQTVLQGALPTYENWSQLPITKAIFLESIRLFPSIWCIPRVSLEDDYIGDYYIPRDTHLVLNIFALHRNPQYWEEPNVFYPERFIGGEEKRSPFSFLPFSLGPRTCIGSQFAMMEGVLLLAMIAQKYQLMLPKQNKIYNPEPYLSLRPPHKVIMKLISNTD